MPVRYTAEKLMKILKKDGWYVVNTEGSHYQFEHETKEGKIAVPYHKGDVHPKVATNILKKAGLK
ncbi:MAG: type II toxin-antitoxin system HicA family toxin [Alphaproteobacteria bacterium]|nr:type II toxin-antitoxin system HicA family toxin [Alphaproteobacteria bacterium]